MTASDTHTSTPTVAAKKRRYRPGSLELFGAILLIAILLRGPLESLLG